jgi:hypothetical protein
MPHCSIKLFCLNLFNHYRFLHVLTHMKRMIQIIFCSDRLLGYNCLLYTNCLLRYNCLLYVNCLPVCNCLLYANHLLGYNLVKSGSFCFCCSVMLFYYFCHSWLPLIFLPLRVATHISVAQCCGSYFCHSSMCWMHSLVDICEQRHAPTI